MAATLSFEILKSFESEMQTQYAAHASKRHGDIHTYTLKSVTLEPLTTGNWVALLTVELDVRLDDGFKDHYRFQYSIGSNYKMGRYEPNVPLSQTQVFDAYDTWGEALATWLRTVYYATSKTA